MILLFAGTSEGREAAKILKNNNHEFIVSVATESGAKALNSIKVKTICSKLDCHQIKETIEKQKIKTIIDATHPFAVNVKKNIIDACRGIEVGILKIEREHFKLPESHLVKTVANVEEAAKLSLKLGKTILLTIGVKELEKFVKTTKNSDANLIVRVLPSKESVKKCLDLGFLKKNILTGTGPFDADENAKTIENHKINVIVTKDTGSPGGLPEKIEAALKNNVYAIVINRLPDPYKNCNLKNFKSVDLKSFCRLFNAS